MSAHFKETKICLVVHDIGPFKKQLIPELNQRFKVTIKVLKDTYIASGRFDKKRRIIQEITNFVALFTRIPWYLNHDVTVCLARKRHLSFLVFGRILKVFGVNFRVYVYGFYIQSWAFNRILRYLMSLVFTENVAVLVISKSDMNFLKALSPKSDIRYYPFCQAPRSAEKISVAELGDYVFAGGHTNRDYDTVVDCAKKMPQVKFVVVRSQYTQVKNPIPSNVTVYEDLDGDGFYTLLAKSRLVLIPLLRKGFSAGQTIALASMQYGKTTIFSNFENVSQYFDDGVNGIQYISGDVTSLKEAIEQVVGDKEKLLQIGQLAQEKFKKYYTRDKLLDAIVAHIEVFSKKTLV